MAVVQVLPRRALQMQQGVGDPADRFSRGSDISVTAALPEGGCHTLQARWRGHQRGDALSPTAALQRQQGVIEPLQGGLEAISMGPGLSASACLTTTSKAQCLQCYCQSLRAPHVDLQRHHMRQLVDSWGRGVRSPHPAASW